MSSVDDQEYSKIEIYFELRQPPSPQEFTESMRAEVNQLRQELLQSPPPQQQHDFPPRQPSIRSPPQQLCYVYRVITDMIMKGSKGDGRTSEGKSRFLYRFSRSKRSRGLSLSR